MKSWEVDTPLESMSPFESDFSIQDKDGARAKFKIVIQELMDIGDARVTFELLGLWVHPIVGSLQPAFFMR